MMDDRDNQGSRRPAALGSDLDADPFAGGRRSSRGATRRKWGLKTLALLVAVGFGLHALLPLLRADRVPPSASLLAPQSPALAVEVPPAGPDRLLSAAQIRWCLREDIRIEVLQRTAHDTRQFNVTVADYNRRCTRFRYRNDELEQARRDVDDARPSIVEEATIEAYKSAAPAKSGRPAAADYSVLTKDVQELLSALGYAPGAVDGFYGAKTKTAVEAFEADQGRRPSGAISEALRHELLVRVRDAGIAEARLFEATAGERQAIRESCADAAGVAAYNRCVESALERLAGQRAPQRAVTETETAVIDQACARAKLRDGDAGHERCVADQLADLAQLDSKPNLAALTESEHTAIDDACDSVGAFYGPAAFYRCAQERLAEVAGNDARTRVSATDAARSSQRR